MTAKIKTNLKIVESAKKPKGNKRTGSGNGSGGGSSKGKNKVFGEYAIINGSFHHRKATRSSGDDMGFVDIPLCNFKGHIVEEVMQDNGLEDTAILRIEGVRQDGLVLPVADVPASKFYGGQGCWANDAWGTKAFIYPGSQKKDHLRACFHQYSQLEKDIPQRVVFQYTGWKKLNSKWCYLSGSGAITADGLDETIQVDLGVGGHMARYSLPKPPDKEQLKAVSGSVLDLLGICPNKPQIRCSFTFNYCKGSIRGVSPH